MTNVYAPYDLQLPPLNQLIDKTIKDTVNIFSSLFELGRKYRSTKLEKQRNIYVEFVERFQKILPKKTEEAIIKDIIFKLPKRQWLISDYDIIMEVFVNKLSDKKIKDLESLFTSTFNKPEEIPRFITLFFNEVSVKCKQDHEFWQDMILEESDTAKMHIYNEISLSLKEIIRASSKYSGKFYKKSLAIVGHIVLQSLRITQILALLKRGKLKDAKINSKYLRAERFEMKQNA